MKVVTTEDLINIDKKTIEKIPSVLLMEPCSKRYFLSSFKKT